MNFILDKALIDKLLETTKSTLETLNTIKQRQKEREEHTKPKVEWEVVHYRVGDVDYIKEKDSKDYFNKNGGFYFQRIREDRLPADKLIWAVRRLPDQEVFSIGDEVEYGGWDGRGEILEFEKYDKLDDLVVRIKYNRLSLKDIRKPTKLVPLFKTEDGFEIFDGELVVFYVGEQLKVNTRKAKNAHNSPKCHKIFLIKEKAEEYVLNNKPLLSVNDVISISECTYDFMKLHRKRLGELAKEKLSK